MGEKTPPITHWEQRPNIIVRLVATRRKTTVKLLRRVFRSPGTRCCNTAFMFTLLYITVCYVNVVLRYVKVTLRYGMLCLVDLCTMNEFNRTEPLLHKLTFIWTLASVHGGSQQHSYGSIPGTVRCFPLVHRVQTGSGSQPAPTR